MYNKKVMDLFLNPKNAGNVKCANAVGRSENIVVVGETVKISLLINEKTFVIENACFKTLGGVVAIAASSVVTTLVKDKTIDENETLSFKDVLNVLGEVPSDYLSSVAVAVEAYFNAIVDFRKKQLKKNND